MSFQGKVAVVTGGLNGIGRETARIFCEKGASVAIADFIEDVDDVVEALKRETGNENIICVRTDVSRSEQVQNLVNQTVSAFGRIDCLVNSAAVRKAGNTVTLEEKDWDTVIGVNLRGMFLTAKYCIPHMKEAGSGSIVNISSVQAFASQKNVVAYTTSKGGINAMTRAMAMDHASDNIRVNSVCPGTIETPSLRVSAGRFEGEKTLKDWGADHPIGRLGRPSEVADFVVYLCSENASFMTGGAHTVDGGLLAKLPCQLPE